MHFAVDHCFHRALLTWPCAQTKRDVVKHGHVFEQRVMLEHEANLTFTNMGVRRIFTIEIHATGVGIFKPGNDAQQRRSATTGRAEQRHRPVGKSRLTSFNA